jgi:hypothetical protein
MLPNKVSNGGNELSWNRHRRIRRVFERRFILGDGLVIALGIVMVEDAFDASLIPARRKRFVVHNHFALRRRRSAFFALGPRSYAVTTNIEPGSGSGT